MVTTFAGSTSAGNVDGYGTSAKFNRPYAAVPDGKGNIYVADYLNNSIRKISIATGLVTTVAGSGSYGYADGVGTAAMFRRPTDVAFDGGTNLYVADANDNMIRQIDLTTGTVSTLAGNGSTTSSDGTGIVAGFDFPTNLVYDGSGDLYVSDQDGDEIRQIVIATQVVTTVAGTGSNGAVDGTGIAASFYRPAGITYDGSGKLYIADEYNNEIRQVVISSGVVTTLAGTTSGGSTNGTGTAASFSRPYGVTYDGNGNLYVADYNNSQIRKIVIATAAVTTFAGSSGGSTNGTVTAARFNHPTDVRYDGAGNLYVSEYSNSDIRKITMANTYNVVVTDGNGCKNSASFGSITVNALPTITVSGTSTIALGTQDTLTAKGTSVSYVWNSGSTSDTTMVTPLSNLTYTVTGTGANGCSDTATFKVTIAPLSIASLGTNDKTTLYPNPTINAINLTFAMHGTDVAAEVTIMDAIGKEVMTENTTIGNGKVLTLNVGMLAQGTYFVRVITNNITHVERFVKQ